MAESWEDDCEPRKYVLDVNSTVPNFYGGTNLGRGRGFVKCNFGSGDSSVGGLNNNNEDKFADAHSTARPGYDSWRPKGEGRTSAPWKRDTSNKENETTSGQGGWRPKSGGGSSGSWKAGTSNNEVEGWSDDEPATKPSGQGGWKPKGRGGSSASWKTGTSNKEDEGWNDDEPVTASGHGGWKPKGRGGSFAAGKQDRGYKENDRFSDDNSGFAPSGRGGWKPRGRGGASAPWKRGGSNKEEDGFSDDNSGCAPSGRGTQGRWKPQQGGGDVPRGGGFGGQTSGECYKCNEPGHLARDCPNAGSNAGGIRGQSCFKCNKSGHFSRDCPNEGRVGADGQESKPREIYIPPDLTSDEKNLFEEGISTGINFDRYENISVHVTGGDAPFHINSFEESELRDLIKENVQKSHYSRPTPVQKYAIPIIMAERDLMACSQTGSGKTAAFLLPVLHGLLSADVGSKSGMSPMEPDCVIISPTRELAIQTYIQANKFARGSIVKSVVVYGGTSVQHQSQQIMRGCHILVATPGRLLDFLDKGRISFSSLKYLILDEADRMLDMGFMPDIRKMVDHPTMPPKGTRQTLMFSATFPEEVQRIAGEYLSNYLFLAVGLTGGACSDVTQSFHQVQQYDKRGKLEEVLTDAGSDKTLVFVETKRTADFLAAYLSQNGFPTTSIHGDRLQREREEALGDFKSGRMPILVATAVAARGLDIKNVAHVVNYDLPSTVDEYVHRIGRTGRVGNTGKATSFFDEGRDQPLAQALVKILSDALQEVPDWLVKLAASAGYGQTFGGTGRFGGRDVRRFGGTRPKYGDYGGFDNDSAESPKYEDQNSYGGGGGGGGLDTLEGDENWE